MEEKKKPLMYVDDEFINLELFRLNFESEYSVITARSGREALEILKDNAVHVIISDLKMPGMNGLEFIEKVKEREPGKICMILTAYMEPEVILKSRDSNLIFKYMSKPWQKNELGRAIREAFEKHGAENKINGD